MVGQLSACVYLWLWLIGYSVCCHKYACNCGLALEVQGQSASYPPSCQPASCHWQWNVVVAFGQLSCSSFRTFRVVSTFVWQARHGLFRSGATGSCFHLVLLETGIPRAVRWVLAIWQLPLHECRVNEVFWFMISFWLGRWGWWGAHFLFVNMVQMGCGMNGYAPVILNLFSADEFLEFWPFWNRQGHVWLVLGCDNNLALWNLVVWKSRAVFSVSCSKAEDLVSTLAK